VRGGIAFYNAKNSWAKNVFIHEACRAHILIFQSSHITVRNSYFDESHEHASQSYGVEWALGHDCLVENNIMHRVTAPFLNGGGSFNVVAYNYTYDNVYTPSISFMRAGQWFHAAGISFNLVEGNTFAGVAGDGIHGTQHFNTIFRNRLLGREFPWQTDDTNSVAFLAFSRFHNVIGNVLGDDTYHTVYLNTGTSSDSRAVINVGASPGPGVPADSHVRTSLMLWGNYDTVNDAARWEPSELPSSLTKYANGLPASTTLPSSLYLKAKPAWFGSVQWPPIGPDVTGGYDSSVANHVHKIPAQLCYETGAKDSNGQLTAFNANNCYPS
jgi:hypothetical protein